MNAPTISNPVKIASPAQSSGSAASVAGGADGAEGDLDFAGLLGAGIARSTGPAQARETTQIATQADDDASAVDPAALLDTIAAGKSNLDFAGLPGTAVGGATGPQQERDMTDISKDAADDGSARDAAIRSALQPVIPAVLVAVNPTGAQARKADSTAEPITGHDSVVSSRMRAEDGKCMAPDLMQGTAYSLRTSAAAIDADTKSAEAAAQIAPTEPAAVSAPKAEPQPHRFEPVSQLTTVNGAPSQAAIPGSVVAHVERLSRPFGSPAWEDAFSSRVVWMARGGVQSAEIRLNPQELGPIEVKMVVTNDPGAQATASIQFSATQAATREAIESALPRLREMLLDSGIALGNTTVDARTAGNTHGSGDSSRPPHGNLHAHPDQIPEPAVQSRAGSPLRRGNGLVDTFA